MTTIAVAPVGLPTALGPWLLPESDELRERIGRAADTSAAVGRSTARRWPGLEKALRDAVVARVIIELRHAFPDPLVTAMVNGLRLHDQLTAAARSTIADPWSVADVLVGRYRPEVRHPVDVEVDAPFATLRIPFELVVEFVLVEARAHVFRGRITSLGMADPAMHGRVTAYEKEVFSRAGALPLGGTLLFSEPVSILDDAEERRLRAAAAAGPRDRRA
jgi:hypothetical protein